MRVFSVEMLVKEEGAAVVEAALKRLKNEAKAVAAEMKVTTSNVTNTGTAMKAAGQATEIAKDRAAKAAIGFAAVGQSMARTGSLTADAGTRIIEAGSQIATMFGPGGLAVAALLAFAAAAVTSFGSAAREAKKLREEFEKELEGLVNADDIVVSVETIQRKIEELRTGTVYGDIDAIVDVKDGIAGMRAEIQRLREAGFRTDIKLLASPELVRLEREIATAESNIKRYEAALERLGREPIAQNAKDAADAQKRYNDELERAIKLNADVRGAIQEREAGQARGISTIGMTRFGTGLEAGAAERAGRPAAPLIDTAAIERDVLGATAEIAGIIAAADIDQQLLGAIRLDELKNGLADGIAGGIEGGVTSGVEMALASGNITDAFKAMGQAIIQSMASAMVKVALKAIGFASKMKAIQSFMASHPALALASAVALLAIARAAGGGSGGADMVGTGGPGGLTYSAAGTMATPTSQIIFGATSATTAAGMQPRSATNVTIIGPNDPSAQRAMQELLAKANSRGRVG
jgi:hypothetical protein